MIAGFRFCVLLLNTILEIPSLQSGAIDDYSHVLLELSAHSVDGGVRYNSSMVLDDYVFYELPSVVTFKFSGEREVLYNILENINIQVDVGAKVSFYGSFLKTNRNFISNRSYNFVQDMTKLDSYDMFSLVTFQIPYIYSCNQELGVVMEESVEGMDFK
ncbi:MAG: hypothetical protein P857_294 [Candidatus Xenolissoclinum pacificiensis L6]|uniref:Uncharacterized protein n=1 Tax=Candidatus Xenolissoclinum pacificiensis L6 TaxID=1401685 RepID=W2UZI4_9RICK|nr:MAG: hypothetical protein P857_294 [Candidatus Xenolissoclinum pacificiensis L6]